MEGAVVKAIRQWDPPVADRRALTNGWKQVNFQSWRRCRTAALWGVEFTSTRTNC